MAGTKVKVKDMLFKPILSSGDGSNYILNIERFSSYDNGITIFWTPHVTNESGATINVNGLGAIPLKDKGGVAIGAGELKVGVGYFITYNNGEFKIINLGEGGGGGEMQDINMVFDDETSDLPASTSVTIDGCTINDGDVIYVKACYDTNKVGKFYEAQVNGTDVGWLERGDLNKYNPTYVECGSTYGGKVNYFVDYFFSSNVIFGGDTVTYLPGTEVDYNSNTINYDNVIENYTNSTSNYDDNSSVNYNNTTINYNSTYNDLGCTNGITSFPANVALQTGATKASISISYDNSINDSTDIWNKTIEIVEGTNIFVTENGKTGKLHIVWNTGGTEIEINKISGDGNFTIDVCQYSGGVIINDNGSITNNQNTIVNNNNTTEYYDSQSTIINEGDTILRNLYVTNIYNESGEPIGGSGVLPRKVELSNSGNEIYLPSHPLGDGDGLTVLYKNSGQVWFEIEDYTYDAVNNKVVLNNNLTTGETVQVRYLEAHGQTVTSYTVLEVNTGSMTLAPSTFNLVTYSGGDVTLTLPDANTCEGQVVRVKKFTGEDINNVIIVPQSGQAIDGNTDGVSFNIDKGQYAFIAYNGNWYIF